MRSLLVQQVQPVTGRKRHLYQPGLAPEQVAGCFYAGRGCLGAQRRREGRERKALAQNLTGSPARSLLGDGAGHIQALHAVEVMRRKGDWEQGVARRHSRDRDKEALSLHPAGAMQPGTGSQ